MKGSSFIRATAIGPPRPYVCRPCQRRFLHATRARRANDEQPSRPPVSTASVAGVNIGSALQPSSARPKTTQPKTTQPKTTRPKTTWPKANNPARPQRNKSGEITAASFKPYTRGELKKLRKQYTPAQMRAILAGERAIDPHDLATQTLFRTNDPWAIDYDTDFAHHHPVLDKPIRAPESHHDPTLRFKTADEIKADVINFMADLPDEATEEEDLEPTEKDLEFMGKDPEPTEEDLEFTGKEFVDWRDNQARLMVGKEEAERDPIHYLAPEIPKGIPGLADRVPKKKLLAPMASTGGGGGRQQEEEEEVSPALLRLMKQTGYSSDEIRKFRTKLLVSHRVVNQTRLGKIQSIYYLAVAGAPQRGLLGIGEGKAAEAGDARQIALYAAIRNLTPIPRYEFRTIFGDVKGKVGGVELELFHRPPGFGIRCQHLIHEMCRCAGITDMSARVGRSRNKMNTVKATMKALLGQRLPEEVSRGLGRKLVDARKVYYGGIT